MSPAKRRRPRIPLGILLEEHELVRAPYPRITCAGFLVPAAQLVCTKVGISIVPLWACEKLTKADELTIEQPESRVSRSQPWAIVATLVFAIEKGGERECRLRLHGADA
jgi:hypothetical protein